MIVVLTIRVLVIVAIDVAAIGMTIIDLVVVMQITKSVLRMRR